MTAHHSSKQTQTARPGGLIAFGREWLRDPLRVAAVAPSSRSLARAITDGIGPNHAPVIELGPGTGVFTDALVARGIPPERIAAFEAGANFVRHLARRWPSLRLVHDDAARLRHLAPFGHGGAGAIVCGLPLLSMPPAKVYRIIAGAFGNLRPGGHVALFTYAPRCPVPTDILDRLELDVERTAIVLRNLPPAFVYRLSST